MNEWIYGQIVRKNEHVQYEYERYVQENLIEHYESRRKHWRILRKLIWHYCIQKKEEPLLYFNEKADGEHPAKPVPIESSDKQQKSSVQKIPAASIPCPQKTSPIPESQRTSFAKEIHFAKRLLAYDVISFDIFDTLIFRPFFNPRDLFILLGEKTGIADFYTLRMNAEKRAREIQKCIMGTDEVTLQEIYQVMEQDYGIDAEQCIKAELELELELCFANPYMKHVFHILLGQGKEMIAISDMYLNSMELKRILDKNGYEKITHIFSSADYHVSKRNGELFRYVQQKYPNKKIIHIGDNFQNDCKMAREIGFDAIYYRNVNLSGKETYIPGMSKLIGSASLGIINAKFYSHRKAYSIYYETGYKYLGIYVLGYVNWIYKKALANSTDKILFLSRDADIYHQIFRKYHEDIPCEYFYWSRIASIKCDVRKNWSLFLTHFFEHKSRYMIKSKLIDIFTAGNLLCLSKYFAAYSLHEDEYLTKFNLQTVKRLLWEHRNEVYQAMDLEKEELCRYVKTVIGKNERIILVDIGWGGGMIKPLRDFILENTNAKDVFCCFAAARPTNDTMAETDELTGRLESYMFSPHLNADLFHYHKKSNKNLNTFFMEMLTQSSSPSFEGIRDGAFIFGQPEVENYEINAQVHEGIHDFIDDYTTIFKNHPYMYQIPARDAYMPFMKLSKNPNYFYEHFGNFVFGRGTLLTNENHQLETVRQVIESSQI